MVQNLEEEKQKLGVLLKTMAPRLFDGDPIIDTYEDGAVMEYALTEQMDMETVLNILEDDADLTFIYNARKTHAANGEQHACLAEDPSSSHMFKVNVFTDHDSIVTRLTVSIYTSVDDMKAEVESDIENHRGGGFYIDAEISQRELRSLFLIM